MLYERIVRPLLFAMDAERAHDSITRILELAGRTSVGRRILARTAGPAPMGLETQCFGLRFPNPIGAAAGFDKDCRLFDPLAALGFGFIEAGSITLRPQTGNPRPRLHRIPEAQAIINRMGFNSAGAAACAARLRDMGPRTLPLGINLGLNADCPREKAAQEYAACLKSLEPFGDYFVVNVSSPNTAGLRGLQERLQLERILTALAEANPRSKPLLVKIDPDLEDEPLRDLVGLVLRAAAGIVVSNTSLSREGIPESCRAIPGGLSGAPLRPRSTRLIRRVFELAEGRLPIIGVGGVSTGQDAYEKIRSGAGLIQLYTGLVYRGPAAARRIQEELKGCLKRDGFKSVAEAVGTAQSPPQQMPSFPERTR